MLLKKISNLTPEELDQVVKLHLKTLGDSFITNFGQKFLTLAYRQMVQDDQNIFITLTDQNKIRGFLVATLDDSSFTSRSVKSNWLNFLIQIGKSLVTNPSLLIPLFWLISQQTKNLSPKTVELKYICVDPQYQSHGLGTKLIKYLNHQLQKLGITNYQVGTQADNPKSNHFYQKLGFTFLNSHRVFDSTLNFYLSPKLS